jgi:membrane protease YdiL (CAAX protease family)
VTPTVGRGVGGATSGSTWGLLDAVGAVLLAIVGSSIVAVLLQPGDDPSLAQQFLINIPLWASLALVPIWATTRKGRGPVEDLGLRFSPVDVLIGLVAGTFLQLVLVDGVYWLLRDVFSEDEVLEPARKLAGDVHGASWILLLVMVLVLAPVVEELFYRGLVMRSLDRYMPPWASVLVSALVFAAMHFQPVQLVGLTLFGIVCGALVQWTGRLGTSMVTHMVFNAWAIWQIRWR